MLITYWWFDQWQRDRGSEVGAVDKVENVDKLCIIIDQPLSKLGNVEMCCINRTAPKGMEWLRRGHLEGRGTSGSAMGAFYHGGCFHHMWSRRDHHLSFCVILEKLLPWSWEEAYRILPSITNIQTSGCGCSWRKDTVQIGKNRIRGHWKGFQLWWAVFYLLLLCNTYGIWNTTDKNWNYAGTSTR